VGSNGSRGESVSEEMRSHAEGYSGIGQEQRDGQAESAVAD
jgi:hypothetical protein